MHTLLEKHDGKPIDESDHKASNEALAAEQLADKDPHARADQAHESRLLTKNQISEMALGIRELSKKLSQIRLKLNVRNVFILGKAHDETLIKFQRETAEWILAKHSRYNVYEYTQTLIGHLANSCSYVEDKLESNRIFDSDGLMAVEPSYRSRLKYWNNELCDKKPQTFDIVLAVSTISVGFCKSLIIDRFTSSAETVQSSTPRGCSSASCLRYSPSHLGPLAS